MHPIETLVNSLPLSWKLERRASYSRARGHLFRILAVLLALVLTGIVIEASGESALAMAGSVLRSTLGSRYGWQQLLLLATPLILNGTAFLLGIRMQLFNFGLEGQLYIGAFAAAGVGLNLQGPPWLMVPLMLLASAAGGSLYAAVPALMRIYSGVSEILTTLLMNPLAIQWATYIGMIAWRDRISIVGGTSNATPRVPYELPVVGGDFSSGILIAILAVIGVWIAFSSTVWGYEVTSIGANRGAAEFAGMPVVRKMLVVMMLSGALAGLSGAIELLGAAHRYSGRLSPGYGWLGIDVAILAGGEPLPLIAWGLFLALILNGGTVLKVQGLSVDLVIALTGLILLLASIGEVLANYRLVPVSRLGEGVEDAVRGQT